MNKTTPKEIEAAAKQTNNVVIQIQHLKKSFGQNTVLNDLNLKIFKGENLVVLGKSGSGKSVLIKCLVGLIMPEEGSLFMLGKNIESLSREELNALRKKVGFLFQSGALYDSMTVRENLLFPLRDIKELSEEEEKRLIEEVLDSVGLEETINKMPAELSGGMRKRLGLARTIILKPEVMLYDEPTTGLDPITSREISNLILKIQSEYKTTSIIIAHDMACSKLTANRILVLKEGKVGAEGTFEELEKSEDKDVRAFFQ